MIALLGSVAFPLTNGVVGEFLLFYGIFQYNTLCALFAGLTVILGAVYMLRAYQTMMHGETNIITAAFGEITMNEKILLGCFAGLIIFFGFFPNVILSVSEEPVKQLIHQVQMSIIK